MKTVSIAQAARELGVCPRTVYHYIARGKLRRVRDRNGSPRVFVEDVRTLQQNPVRRGRPVVQ